MANTKTQEYKSDLIDSLIDTNSKEYKSSKNKMLLALRIKEAMSKVGITNTALAVKLGKNKSVITKWLSGTHNFTSETLFEIQEVLGIKLIELEDKSSLVNPQFHFSMQLNPSENNRTSSPVVSQATLNNFVITHGDC